jgi:O-antigen/teichoic acid export membrane protein
VTTVTALTLKQRILRAGGWTMAGSAVSLSVRLGSSLIMTRLLIPEMFGVMAIATVVLAILHMMSDLGIQQNIVQSRRGEDPAFLDTAWMLQIARGLVLWFVALILSFLLALAVSNNLVPSKSVYAAPILPWIIATSTFSAVISGFQTTGVALAIRKLEQSRLVKMDVISQLTSLACMITAAVATRSIWALVIGGLAGPLTSVILGHTWLRLHRNRFRWEAAAWHELFHFGKWAFLSSILTVLSTNGDRLLLGGYVDTEYLGIYAIAATLLISIEAGVAGVLMAVSLPALSEVVRTAPERLRDVYYKLRVPVDLIMLFFGGALAVAGTTLVDILYDDRFAHAGVILQVLAISFFATRFNISYQIYVALGRLRHLVTINFVRCVAMFVAVPLAFSYGGSQGAVWAIALHGFAMIPLVLWINARLGVLDIRREVLVLLAFPAGMLAGRVLTSIFQ